MLAESKGLFQRDYRQFFMGHKGDIEGRYTTNKNRLPEDVVEDMRGAFRKSQDFLQIRKAEGPGEEQIKQVFKKQLLIVAGYKEEEIAAMNLEMSDEELQQKVRERLFGAMVNNGSKQRVVPVGEVKQFITKGWEDVTHLPEGEAIVKLPS